MPVAEPAVCKIHEFLGVQRVVPYIVELIALEFIETYDFGLFVLHQYVVEVNVSVKIGTAGRDACGCVFAHFGHSRLTCGAHSGRSGFMKTRVRNGNRSTAVQLG